MFEGVKTFSFAQKRNYKFQSPLDIELCKNIFMNRVISRKVISQNTETEFVFSTNIVEFYEYVDLEKVYLHIGGHFIQTEGHVEVILETQNFRESWWLLFLLIGFIPFLSICYPLGLVIFLLGSLSLYYAIFLAMRSFEYNVEERFIVNLLIEALKLEPI